KLKRRGKWGKAHTSFDKLSTGIPRHLRGVLKRLQRYNSHRSSICDKAKEAGYDLIKSGLLLSKPTSYGLEVSLNPKRKDEILKTIEKYLPVE
ncbi:MAG: hypothetical protein LRZ87_01710, partial [Methanocellales archaeon]|nr:hypothetical protein [Methanocellales archaeon]